MAKTTVVTERLSVLRRVISIVASEAAGVIHVPNIVRVCPPCNFHAWKDVAFVNHHESPGRIFDFPPLAVPDIGVLRPIEANQASGDLLCGFVLCAVGCLNELQSFLVNERKIGAGASINHHVIESLLGGLEDVSRLVVTIHAVHLAFDALDWPLPGRVDELCHGTIRVRLAYRDNRLIGGVRCDVGEVIQVGAMDAAIVPERIDSLPGEAPAPCERACLLCHRRMM